MVKKKEPTQMEVVTNLITSAMMLMVGVRLLDVVTRPDRTLKGLHEKVDLLETKLITLHILATDEVIRP